MFKIVICDDDKSFAEIIEHYIAQCLRDKIEYSLITFNSLKDLKEHINQDKVDIIFLDIMVNDKNAMNWSIENISDKHIQLIFMTSYPQSAYNISESRCCYYLVKSRINEENINKALQRAFQNISNNQPDLKIIRSKQRNVTVDLHDIVYIETDNNNILLHLADGKEVAVYSTLKNYSRSLPANFLRCHKCYMVNMNYIKEYRQYKFILNDMRELPIPQKKYRKVIEAYKNYINLI